MSIVHRLLVAGAALAVAVGTAGVVAPNAQASTGSSFVSAINSARVSHGLRAYQVSSDLTSVALGQAHRMADAQRLYHNPGLATQVTSWKYVGENVGYGPDVSTLMTAFMNSAPHRANILDHQFTQVGVGAVTVKGTIWVSMVFREPLHASTRTRTSSPTKSTSSRKTTSHTASPTHHAATKAKPKPKPVAKLTPVQVHLPAGVVCSAAPTVADRVRDMQDMQRDARLLDQTQPVLLGFQCGRALPMTGVLDQATLAALGA